MLENLHGYILYYAFDMDDNLLFMDTKIHMEEYLNGDWVPKDVSTNEFAEVRTKENFRIINNNPSEAFSEFRDTGPRGLNAFLADVKLSVSKNQFGPSWQDFIECLVNGSIFSIITARGHESEGMLPGIEWIVDEVLTVEQKGVMYSNLVKFETMFGKDISHLPKLLRGKPSDNPVFKRYLSYCDLVGISSPSNGGDTSNPEGEKVKALLSFKEKVNGYAKKLGIPAKIGFSDDDPGNVKRIEDLINNLDHERFSHIKEYIVKDTNDPDNVTKMVRTIESNANISVGGSPGLRSSLVGFKDFGKLSDKTHTNSSEDDDAGNTLLRRSSRELAKMAKEIVDDEKEKEASKNMKISKKKEKKVMEHLNGFSKFNEKQDMKKVIEADKLALSNPITKEEILQARDDSKETESPSN